ncbi:DUF4097 family beta strand repeat-containing protein [Bacillus tuaregi]|uniref:DUF4097 family beta strand repeat-containing protein n=1 Tax=Bacillus tuaregi TaxID=1816695 RepID=UPI0008F896CC|nr:DUF4097 family beta strand repeat-containing protein [Bacillus tuaregi]
MRKLLVLVVILLAAFVLYFSIPSSWFGLGKQSAAVTDEIERIELDVSGINTRIITEDRDDVEANLEGKGKLRVSERGNSIEIEYKRRWFESFSFFSGPKLTLYIPEDYQKDLEIEIGSGNLNYAGESKGQPVVLNKLSVEVNSGNAKLSHIQTNKGVFDVNSGNVSVEHYAGQLTADISSGNINIQMDQLTDSIEVDVSSGRASIDLPDKADFTLDGKVSSGNISNTFILKDKQETERELSGIHGSGKHAVDINISSGKIELK